VKHLLTELRMLQLLPATDGDVTKLRLRMETVRPGGIEEWVIDGWRGGEQRIFVIADANANRRVAVWWWRAQNGNMVVNAAGRLDGNDNYLPVLFAGVEKKAREIGAPEIVFQTRRLGLIHSAQTNGYAVSGVCLCKKL
jgi:hypothetical protein